MRRSILAGMAAVIVTAVSLSAPPVDAAVPFVFQPVESYAHVTPTSPQIADLDGDGRLDVVVGSSAGSDLALMNNDGDGTFTVTTKTACPGPAYPQVGSVNSNTDTTLDIVTSCQGANFPKLLSGAGNGTFANAVDAVDDCYISSNATLGHFNSGPSGGLDFAGIGYAMPPNPWPLCTAIGNGAGAFPLGEFHLLYPQGEVSTVNVQFDGRDTGIFIDSSQSAPTARDRIHFFGYDDVTGWSDSLRATGSQRALALATGDIDGDGTEDLVVGNQGPGGTNPNFTIMRQGSNGFPIVIPPTRSTIPEGVQDIALGDFNGDGKLDVAVMAPGHLTNPNASVVGIHPGRGDGTFGSPQSFFVGANGDTHSIAAGDIDGDGRDDLIVTVANGGRIDVLRTGDLTYITSGPKKVIKTNKKQVTVRFEFGSIDQSATFQCTMDGSAPATCVSGDEYVVGRGTHTFTVAAVVSGTPDPTPATYTFKVKRR